MDQFDNLSGFCVSQYHADIACNVLSEIQNQGSGYIPERLSIESLHFPDGNASADYFLCCHAGQHRVALQKPHRLPVGAFQSCIIDIAHEHIRGQQGACGHLKGFICADDLSRAIGIGKLDLT